MINKHAYNPKRYVWDKESYIYIVIHIKDIAEIIFILS